MTRSLENSTRKTGAAARADAATLGMHAGTCVLTLDGEIPVEFLNEGDRVITRSGARALRRVSSRVYHDAAVVQVRSGSLGHDRPGRDLVLGASQPVLVRDWRAQALFGSAQVLVPAARLADGEFVRTATFAEVRLFTLEFDGPETIYADGVELGCAKVTVAA